MSHSIDHPDFTALAIGESIGSAPAQALTDTLRGSVAARHEADSIHTTAENLRAALQRQTHPGLDESRRNLVLNVTRSEAIERLGTDDKEDSGIGKTVPMREQASPSPFRIWAGVAAAVAVTVTILKLIPAGGPTKPMATPDELTDAVRLFPSPPQPLPHRAQPPQQIIPAINPQKEQLVEIPAPPPPPVLPSIPRIEIPVQVVKIPAPAPQPGVDPSQVRTPASRHLPKEKDKGNYASPPPPSTPK